jgi:hypothetical protein
MVPILAAVLAFTMSFGVTKEDIRKLLDAGVSDSTIIEYIRANGPAEPLSVDDVTDLKKAGAGDSVLRAMLDSSRATDAVTPSTDRSTTTYSSTSPSYSYYSSYPSYSYPSYSYYSTPYYYPYYSTYYPSVYFSYYPRSYYSSYRYPYYHNHNYYNYPRYNHYPNSVTPYRGQHPQTVQPSHAPRHGGVGPYRR